MLILNRRQGEQIQIGDNLTITVLGLDRSGGVRLGFDGPRDVEIWRGEVYDRLKAERDDGDEG